MSQEDCLKVHRDPRGWALLTLNRPAKLNTLSIELRQTLDRTVRELEAGGQVHVLILTGEGRAFCAGLDLEDWRDDNPPAAGAYEWDAAASLRRFGGPVIAAVNGLAFTGGLEVLLSCDLVLASEAARFADTHVRVGLLPGWGGSVRMIERMGLARTRHLALTGRTFSAHEAERWGLVSEVLAPEALLPRAVALAEEMLGADPEHLRRYKRLLDEEAELLLGSALRHERAQSMAANGPVDETDIAARLNRLRGSGAR